MVTGRTRGDASISVDLSPMSDKTLVAAVCSEARARNHIELKTCLANPAGGCTLQIAGQSYSLRSRFRTGHVRQSSRYLSLVNWNITIRISDVMWRYRRGSRHVPTSCGLMMLDLAMRRS